MSSMIMSRSTRGAGRVLKLKGMWERPRAPKEFCVGYVRSWLPRAAVAASPARVELGWPAQPARAFATAASRRAALPEHVEMPMPRLVPSMEQGVISRWLVEEGEFVDVGELVCEIDVADLTSELPHATMLIESHETGYIAKKLRSEGETVAVDLAIAVFCEEVEDVLAFSSYPISQSASINSGAGSGKGEGRLFCWQAYLKEEGPGDK